MQLDDRPSSCPTLRWLAIAAILGTRLNHLVGAQDAFGDAMYKGVQEQATQTVLEQAALLSAEWATA
jgi:hypothetical protein